MTITEQKLLDDIKAAEAKDKLVLEYLNLTYEFMDVVTNWSRKAEIKIRLNDIKKILGMELLTWQQNNKFWFREGIIH